MNVIVAIQARMSSTRMPGKVMADLCGKPMLQRVYDACVGPWERIVLTSVSADDDVIESYCWGRGITCKRGSLEDVLSRYVMLARQSPDCLVRVCADAPFLQKEWIEDAIALVAKHHLPVFKAGALHAGHWTHWEQANAWCAPEDREHAGHDWFKDNGMWREAVSEEYLTVNTPNEMEEARRLWMKA